MSTNKYIWLWLRLAIQFFTNLAGNWSLVHHQLGTVVPFGDAVSTVTIFGLALTSAEFNKVIFTSQISDVDGIEIDWVNVVELKPVVKDRLAIQQIAWVLLQVERSTNLVNHLEACSLDDRSLTSIGVDLYFEL